MVTITEFFKRIGAPLANPRWSWGGVAKDGTVILRAWQDGLRTIGDKKYFRLTNHSFFKGSENNHGYQERIRHVDLVASGAACLLVMCLAKDPKAHPREIASFNSNDLFVGGELLSHEGDYWIEFVDRKSWRKLR